MTRLMDVVPVSAQVCGRVAQQNLHRDIREVSKQTSPNEPRSSRGPTVLA